MKMCLLDLYFVEEYWGNMFFDFSCFSMRVQYGCIIVNVYAPQDEDKNHESWLNSFSTIHRFDDEVIVMDYYNEVKDQSEWLGSTFIQSSVEVFINFISQANLVDIPLGGVTLQLI